MIVTASSTHHSVTVSARIKPLHRHEHSSTAVVELFGLGQGGARDALLGLLDLAIYLDVANWNRY
jgi:hypothetical protein